MKETRFLTRPRVLADDENISHIVTAAFASPDEARLIARLRETGDMVLELVALNEGQLCGHIAFSRLQMRCAARTLRAVALAPLAVTPAVQREGAGVTLIRDAHNLLRKSGEQVSVVLGHPAYYPRFGYSDILARKLRAPYRGPSFMALEFAPATLGEDIWDVIYAKAFQGNG